jgi:predicted nucleic acid-binding protein
MKGERTFFDTNVLIYAFAKGDSRTAIAESLLVGGGVFSVQTLNEFVAVAVRKLVMPGRKFWRRSARYAYSARRQPP